MWSWGAGELGELGERNIVVGLWRVFLCIFRKWQEISWASEAQLILGSKGCQPAVECKDLWLAINHVKIMNLISIGKSANVFPIEGDGSDGGAGLGEGLGFVELKWVSERNSIVSTCPEYSHERARSLHSLSTPGGYHRGFS